MTTTQATLINLDELAPLFDAYRIFYNQKSDVELAKKFLKERLTQKDAVIFIAHIKNQAVGFTQLYPLFSSVSIRPILLLNDLYVDANFRNKGIGEALINEAKQLCKTQNNKGLAIQTAFNNPAQELYLRLGFKKDTDLHFFWSTE